MIASLHIRTACRKERTVLYHAYYTPPFKVADITEDKKGHTLQLMLMNASPGVLSGDQYTINIELGEGSSLHLHTQAYQRLYTMGGSAAQQCTVKLERGALFCFLPHPTVPHAASDYTVKNRICLGDDCTLLWGEVLTCGRKGSGEIFSYTSYQSITEIMHHEKLVVKENLLLRPAFMPLHRMGMLEGYTHQASLLYWKENGVGAGLADRLYGLLPEKVEAGISSLSAHALVVRLLGYGAEQLYNTLTTLAAHLSTSIKG